MSLDNKTLAGVILFILSAQFIIGLMVGEAMAPGYSIHDNAISDLGVFSETAALFNTSLFLVGILNIAGGYFLYKAYGSKGIFAMFVLAGIGAMGAGLIALDNPIGVHSLFALVAFIFFNAQAIASSKLTEGPMKYISIIAGSIGLIFLILHAASDFGFADLYGPIGHGGSERMIVYPAILWVLAFSGYLLASRRSGMEIEAKSQN